LREKKGHALHSAIKRNLVKKKERGELTSNKKHEGEGKKENRKKKGLSTSFLSFSGRSYKTALERNPKEVFCARAVACPP